MSSLAVDPTQTPQFKTLDALQKGLKNGELIHSSLQTVSRCMPGFLIRWLSNPLASLLGYDLLECYKVSNVAKSLLTFSQMNAEAFQQHDILKTKAFALLTALGEKTKGKYKETIEKTCEAIDKIHPDSPRKPAEGGTGTAVGSGAVGSGAVVRAPGLGESRFAAAVVAVMDSQKISSSSLANPPVNPATEAALASSVIVSADPAAIGSAPITQVTPEEVQKALTDTVHALGDSLQQERCRQGKSVAFSTTALMDILGMLIKGASGDEVEAYKPILALASHEGVSKQLQATRAHLQKAGVYHALCFANASNAKIDPLFAKAAKELFGVEVFTSWWPFYSARTQANGFIGTNTGKAPIKELLLEQFQKGAGLEFALVQGTSIQATLPCAIKEQTPYAFTLTNGEKKQTKLATLHTQANVHEAAEYTLVEVSYKTSDETPLSKVLVLSKDPAKIVTLTAKELQAAREHAKPQEVALVMPQMDFEDKNFAAIESLKAVKLPVGKVAGVPLSNIITACRLEEVDGPKAEGPEPQTLPARKELRFDRSFSFYVMQHDLAVMQGLVDDEKALPKA